MLFDQPSPTSRARTSTHEAACIQAFQKPAHLGGGPGDKRTLRTLRIPTVARALLDAPGWKAKNAILATVAKEAAIPALRSVRRFYLGADAIVQRARLSRVALGEKPERKGFFRGTPKDALEMCQAYQAVGVQRVNLAFREGPYDFDALQGFVETVLPAFGVKRPGA